MLSFTGDPSEWERIEVIRNNIKANAMHLVMTPFPPICPQGWFKSSPEDHTATTACSPCSFGITFWSSVAGGIACFLILEPKVSLSFYTSAST